MAIKTASVGVGTTLASMMTLMAGSALAGAPLGCGIPGGPACAPNTVIVSSPPMYSDAMTVENRKPYDFLDSVHFQQSPHVSITRIHGQDTTVGLSDSPMGFTKGCHPESTAYCRSGSAKTVSAPVVPKPVAPPVVKAPIIVAPKPTLPAPVYRPPLTVAPPSPCSTVRLNPCGRHIFGQVQYSERVVATGRGFDPSKFTPRIYGDPYTITPGIAHVPTSIVDRNPYRAQAVLDSGRARPNPLTVPGGVTPALSGLPIGPHFPYAYHGGAYHGGAHTNVTYRAPQVSGRYGLTQSQTVTTGYQSGRYTSGRYTSGQSHSGSSYSGSRYGGATVCRQTSGRSSCGSSFPRAMSRY
ncbi:MAG: hypothetical protein AAFP97_03675 [Pseudomonadota bacterium]